MATVLGISPGTRTLGIAIIHNGKLEDRKIHSFYQKWSMQKLKTIVTCIEKWITGYMVDAVVIKIPDELPRSVAYIQLIGSLNALLERRGIHAVYYTLSDIKAHFVPERKIGKEELATRVLEKYHVLMPEYSKETKRHREYYMKLFEAVAAAHVFHSSVQ